jgi:pimeloyl-ACP methyl ester carboxylesterase
VARLTPMKNSLRFTAAALKDLARAALGREPFTIPAVGLPGDFAAMTTPDAELMHQQMVPPDVEWVNAVAARIFLSLPLYRPGRRTDRIRCPILFCIAEKDALTPIPPVLAAAARAKQAEVKRYPIAHFDIYLGEWFERAAGDQVEFLRRCLLR